jgi:ankyrin repeat protein
MAGCKEVATLLIAKGADVNAKDDWSGATPLRWAAAGGHADMVELLIARGADVNARDDMLRTALHETIFDGHNEVAERLIANGADVNAKEQDGTTPLHEAVTAISWHAQYMEGSLEAKYVDVDAKDEDRREVFEESLEVEENLQKEMVEFLIAHGADVNAKDAHGGTVLESAMFFAPVGVVEILVVKGADIHARDEDNETPLHLVARLGREDMAELLLARGAHVNVKNRNGATPLGLAVGGRKNMRELLTANDADGYSERGGYFYRQKQFERAIEDYTSAVRLNPKNDNPYYWRGRAWAEKGNFEQAVSDWDKAIELNWRNILPIYYAQHLLESRDAKLDRLIRTVATRHLDDLDEVSGYAVGYSGSPGDFYTLSLILSTPFEEDDFLKMVQNVNPVVRAMALICLARCDASRYGEIIRSFNRDTAEVAYVPFGCGVGRISLDKLAKSIVEDRNVLDYWSPRHTDWTPDTPEDDMLQKAKAEEEVKLVESLVASGADMNVKDRYGDTPLHYAAGHGRKDMIDLLIAKGADINAANKKGETPLCCATLWGHKDAVEFLLIKGANINTETMRGQTPLQIAIEMDYQGLSELLREHGATQ